ncbi:hypothetical protein ETD83_02730 [Actinomadura soli]|uniref:Uncharacterized protein n=1 Tax=Actinomadura soli TaxID=2508997 RepID=A0A5C4JKB8_9ACTN|nr:hypothetical protein [Actinomadura soli]TMR06945.1 hypothetical protein ETD83_02730 [Actinomadura soli]
MAIVRHLRDELGLVLDASPELADATSMAQFRKAIEAIDEPPGTVREMIRWIRVWRDQSIDCHLIDEHLHGMPPKFVYFSDYDIMPGKVSVPDLIARRDQGELKLGEQALISLLAQAGATLEEFNQARNPRPEFSQ